MCERGRPTIVKVATVFLMVSPIATAQDIDVSQLVRDMRSKEAWIEEVESFYVELEGVWTTTPEGIAERRAELERRFPNADLDPERFSDLRPRKTDALVMAFDGSRVHHCWHIVGQRLELRFWNGTMATSIEGDSPSDHGYYAFDDDPLELVGRFFSGHLSWGRAAYHSFWWKPVDAEATTVSVMGHPDDFELVGRQEFQDADCFVLESRGGFKRWYVGADDRLLRGFDQRVLTEDANATEVIRAISERHGQKYTTNRAFYEWRATRPETEQRAMDMEYWEALIDSSRPQIEHYMSDYAEIAPGRWFPMKQGYRFFLKEPDEAGEYPEQSRRVQTVVEIRVDEPLPEELFEYELKEGVEVNDRRYDPPIFYTYDPEMTEDDRQALLIEQKKRVGKLDEEDRAREELIGEPAPAFPETTWLNGEPLTWDDLKGKVVIVDFWADWCGPCRSDLPDLAAMHLAREDTGIHVIGIHTPGSEVASIRKVMDEFDMRYPVYIDVPPPEGERAWGLLYSQYRVYGIPHAFVVDQNGVIAGQGSLAEVRGIARELVERSAGNEEG